MRYGEPTSHCESANAVCKFVELLPGYVTVQRELFEFPDGYKHEFDIIIYKWTTDKITHFVEIGDHGDDSRHSKKSQLIHDGVAKAHVEYYYRDTRYVKINKDDCFYKMWVLKMKLKLV